MTLGLAEVVSISTPIFLAAGGFVLKLILDGQQATRDEISALRSELKELVTKEICAAHRLAIEQRINDLIK